MSKIESLVEAYLTAERDLVAAVDAAGGAVLPCRWQADAPSPLVAPSSTHYWANVASGRGL